MKKIIGSILLVITLLSCHEANQNNVIISKQSSNVQIQTDEIPGFNLQKFASLVKTTKNANTLEIQINDPNSGINTLDLNKDGNVDYLEVVEKSNQLVVIDEISQTSKVTIATLNITPKVGSGDIAIIGNPTYSGPNYNYHSIFTPTDALLIYLLPHHVYYTTPYYGHYGHYPSYYHQTSVIRTRQIITKQVVKTPTVVNSVNKTVSTTPTTPTRTSLNNATTSQKSFSTRDNSVPIKTGGFAKSTPTVATTSVAHTSSSSRSFGSSSSKSFGSSRSSSSRRH